MITHSYVITFMNYADVICRLPVKSARQVDFNNPLEGPGSARPWNEIECESKDLPNCGRCNCNAECPDCAPVCTPFGYCHQESASGSIFHCTHGKFIALACATYHNI